MLYTIFIIYHIYYMLYTIFIIYYIYIALFSYIGIRSKVLYNFKSIIMYDTHVKTQQSSKTK